MEHKLEDLIDAPIKRVVALLNLYGLKTQFSCCGYNYKDQPSWKAHNLTQTYFFIEASDDSFAKMRRLQTWSFTKTNAWMMALRSHPMGDHYWMLGCSIKNVSIPNWKGSMHEYEWYITAIKELEDVLESMSDTFPDEVVVKDFNAKMKEWSYNWEAPSGSDWIVRKEDWIRNKDII